MAERPVECSACQKPVCCTYKEMVKDTVLVSEMCKDCPILETKLHGSAHPKEKQEVMGDKGLFCGSCRTSLEAIKMGSLLGCGECYSVFADVLLRELIATGKIPPRMRKSPPGQKNQPLHVGKSPSKPVSLTLSSKLATLNEALNDALKKENYEQAAWLRDQIKALTEKPADGNK